MAVAKKELERLRSVDKMVRDGSVLTFDGLELIIRACDFDPEKIGRHILEAYWKQKRDK